MTRLELYLLRHLAVATLYSTAGLTLTIWLTQSLRLISLVVEAGAPVHLFAWLLLLTVPTFLGIVLPLSLVGAVLFTYNKLTMDSELVVMRAAGAGPLTLGRPALFLGLVVTSMVYGLNLYVTPMAHRELVHMEYSVRSDYSQLFLREGIFNEIADNLSVYVRERDSEGTLHGILIHDSRDRAKPVTTMGERALMVTEGNTDARFVIFKGTRQELDKATGRLSELFFDRYAVDLKVLATGIGERFPDTRERSTFDLFEPPPEVRGIPSMMQQFRAELHQRFATPLLALAFTAVGLACLLSGEFNRRGQTTRVSVAVGLVVVLEAASLGLSSLSIKVPACVPLLYLLPLLALVPALWVLWRGTFWSWSWPVRATAETG
jgi:lipopolysaccharide export system permease protein